MLKDLIPKDVMMDLYFVQGLTQQKIAEKYGVSNQGVNGLFRSYNLNGIYGRSDTRKFKANDDFFDTWTWQMAYLLGFLLADGNVKDGIVRLELQEKDSEVVYFLRDCICPTQEVKFRQRHDKRTGNIYRMVFVYFSSRKIINKLAEFGIVPNKTGREICPDIPNEFIPDFLRGLIDGDGCIFDKKFKIKEKEYRAFRLQIASACERFLIDIKEKYLFGFGRVSKIKNKCWSLDLSDRERMIKVLSYIYNGNFCLKRKYQKYLDLIEFHESMKTNYISQKTLEGVARKKGKSLLEPYASV